MQRIDIFNLGKKREIHKSFCQIWSSNGNWTCSVHESCLLLLLPEKAVNKCESSRILWQLLCIQPQERLIFQCILLWTHFPYLFAILFSSLLYIYENFFTQTMNRRGKCKNKLLCISRIYSSGVLPSFNIFFMRQHDRMYSRKKKMHKETDFKSSGCVSEQQEKTCKLTGQLRK